MVKTFEMTLVRRLANLVVATLLRAGVKIGPTLLLTVRGRKSGKLYTTPVTPVEQDEQCWLVAPYGAVDWVRNLRAAGEATLIGGHRSEKITVLELDAEQAAPVLKQYLSFASAMVGPYFDVSMASSCKFWNSMSGSCTSMRAGSDVPFA